MNMKSVVASVITTAIRLDLHLKQHTDILQSDNIFVIATTDYFSGLFTIMYNYHVQYVYLFRNDNWNKSDNLL